MTDQDIGLASGIPATGEDSRVEPVQDRRTITMDWEGFFTNYKKPGFIPGYEIVNKLGSGVFGEVYKARKESIGKYYAIKFLKITDEKMSEAIFKELDSLRYFAQLDHPNLVTIEDRGEVMGIPFVVMGYAGDETLKKRIETSAPLPETECFEIFRQICGGVAALHEKSIIHFDLKPANIFLKGHHARVGDYGLSKLVSESHKTMSIGRGTPYYMAPEMLHRTGDHRSDIYSLGVILFQIVTGRVPFTGDSDWAVLKKHETEPVDVPSNVSPLLRHVIERCMEKRPEARFQSVREVVATLDGPSVRARTHTGPIPVPTPPPLPRSHYGAPAQGGVVTEGQTASAFLRRHANDLVKHVSSMPRAEHARQRYQQALRTPVVPPPLPSENLHVGSFYTDFDRMDAEMGAFHDPAPAAAPAAPPAPERDGFKQARNELPPPETLEMEPKKKRSAFFYVVTAPFWLVYLPLKWIVLGVASIFRWTFQGLAVFFRNFLRYAVVLALTAGLILLIRAAILGF